MLTPEQYEEHKTRAQAWRTWAEQYKQRNGWTVIPAGVEPPEGARISNEERSAIEVYEFVNNPPDRYFLYVNEAQRIATTWTGDKLGALFLGASWRDNFGGTRRSVTLHAINGRTYHGTYFKSSGDYARVKLAKGAQ